MQYIFEENVAAFCFKNTNIFLLSTSSFLSNPCLHLGAFWIQNDGKGSTRIERLFQSAFREKLFSKIWKISLGKSHSVEITKTGQLSQKY